MKTEPKDLAQTNQLDFWYPDPAHRVAANLRVDFRVSEKESQSIQFALDQNNMHYDFRLHSRSLPAAVWLCSDVLVELPLWTVNVNFITAPSNRILIHDLQEVTEKQFDVKEDIPGKHSYTNTILGQVTIVAWTEEMVHNHPNMVSRIKIGTTVKDNPPYVLKIGKRDGRRKAIFTDCGIHAREWISPAFCQWSVYQATKTYGKNKIMTKILDRMDFYVLPVFNVDGYIWSWTQNHTWRKNHSRNQGYRCIGSDLNRNFNASWTAKVAKISTDVLSTQYETSYAYGPIASTIYPTSGSSLDWAYNLGVQHAFAFELRDKGKFGFLLPESQMKSTCKETMLAVKFIAKYIRRHAS